MEIISKSYLSLYFEHERREEVIQYVKRKYGKEYVSRIITFGRLQGRTSILDMARIYEYPVSFGRNINKLIPLKPGMTIKRALEEVIELKTLYENDIDVKKTLDRAMRVEGLPRNVSIHACGVIISPQPIINDMPQIYITDDNGNVEDVTQYTMTECEETGALKMDFLGLKTMGILREAMDEYNRIYKKDMKIEDIPLDDPKVYEHIANGNTIGVFQLESKAMTSFMKQLFQDVHGKMTTILQMSMSNEGRNHALRELGEQLFERTIAGISLYRPGPMDEIPKYIDYMMNTEHIVYDTPLLEPILKTTYGIIVYQEEVMQIVRELAGFSRGQADTIRKAMSKKKEEILEEYESYFIRGSGDKIDLKTKQPLNIKGCIQNGISEEAAIRIWNKMKDFAKYAFNKSHAGGYAMISVKTAWLNYYHKTIFMVANLNNYIALQNKVRFYLSYCYKQGIKVLPPCVNKSQEKFSVEEENIRFGLKGLKTIDKSSELIIREREERGYFNSYKEFVDRMVTYQKLNHPVLEALIFSGALDIFPGNRREKILMIDILLDSAKKEKLHKEMGQLNLFDFAETIGVVDFGDYNVEIPNVMEFEKDYLLTKEEEVTGYYLSGHPLDSYEELLKEEDIIDLCELTEEDTVEEEDKNEYVGTFVKVAGMIKNLEFKHSKAGKRFVVFELNDRTGSLNVVCFKVDKFKDMLQDGKKIILTGSFDQNEFGYQLIVSSVRDLAFEVDLADKITVIGSKNVILAREQWRNLSKLSKENKGNTSIIFQKEGVFYSFPTKIKLNLENLNKIQQIFGEENCKINIAE